MQNSVEGDSRGFFHVAPDGKGLLMIKPQSSPPVTQVKVVLNRT
jgi:hypothetical protein